MITLSRKRSDGAYAVRENHVCIGMALVKRHRYSRDSYCGFVLHAPYGGDGGEWVFQSLKDLRERLPNCLAALRASPAFGRTLSVAEHNALHDAAREKCEART